MKPSEMRSIMHAYSAVHSTDVKEELDSSRDQISEMRLTQLTDSDLVEVAEEILEGLFAGGFSVANTQSLLEAVLCESDIPGRQQKVERLQEAFSTVISKVKEKSARTAIESFAEYRHSKSVNEAWVNKFETDRGNVRLHNSLVAQDRLVIKTGLLQMLEKAKSPTTTKEDRGRDLARKAEADAKKRGLKVTDEEWKPYPKEKVERQKSRAYDKEMIARKGKRTDAKDKEADKQYERRIAMDGHPSKMRKVEEEVVDEAKVDAGKTPHEKETARNVRNTPPGGDPKFDRSVFITRKSGENLDSARGRKRRGAHAKRRGVSAAPVAQWKGSKDKVVREGENWIQGAVKSPGAFTKKAKEAGMSVQQFASHVDANKDKYSTRTERQANLAQTFAQMKKEGYDFDAIQEGLTKEGYPVEEVNWVMANGI